MLRTATRTRGAPLHRAAPSALLRPVARPPLSRALCSAPPKDGAAPAAEAETKVLFIGSKNRMVSTLKKLSIANLGFAGASAPLLYYITSATGGGGKGIAMSAILLTFGGATTAGLHWVCGTYIKTLSGKAGAATFTVETPTLLGGSKTTELAWDSIGRPGSWHPFVTFEAGGSLYYLDVEDGDIYDDGLIDKVEEMLNK